MKNKTGLSLIVCMGLAAAGSLASGAEMKPTLYERLGGKDAVRAVVDDFANRIFTDDRVSPWFHGAAANVARGDAYKAHLATFVCQATGGPCHYERDLKAVHHGFGVTKEAFAAVVEDLTLTLEALKVPAGEKSELLGMLAPLESQIVGQ